MPEGTSLENDFMRFIGVTSDSQKRIQEYYLSFFAGRSPVVDLACGDGDFVELLNENGIVCRGVDRDPVMYREAKAKGRTIVCEDVFEFLKEEPPDSLGGLFSAHFVEHLHYEQVIELIALGKRVLQPGGVIILATPNVRGLFAHLESFYLHYGHITFYHPQLLAFFLKRSGFENVEVGENDRLRRPLWGDLPERLRQDQGAKVALSAPLLPNSPTANSDLSAILPFENYEWPPPPGLRGIFLRIIRLSARKVLKPYLLELADRVDRLKLALDSERVRRDNLESYIVKLEGRLREAFRGVEVLAEAYQQLAKMVESLDRSVECYVIARKPSR